MDTSEASTRASVEEGRTREEVKEIVAAIRPKPAAEPTIRRKPVRSGEDSPERRSESVEPAQPESESRRPAGSVEVASPGVYNFRFSVGREFKGKFERLAEVLGIEGAARRMPEIFEKALDLALEKKDPQKKLERRKKRQAARPKTRLDEARRPKTRLDEAAGAMKREERAGSRAFQAPPGAQASRLHLSRYIPSSLLSIGKRNAKLNKFTLKAARAIGPVQVDYGDNSCEPPDIVKHLTSDWLQKKLNN